MDGMGLNEQGSPHVGCLTLPKSAPNRLVDWKILLYLN